jgi:hypothetical protein
MFWQVLVAHLCQNMATQTTQSCYNFFGYVNEEKFRILKNQIQTSNTFYDKHKLITELVTFLWPTTLVSLH